jgi:hypothetical protein
MMHWWRYAALVACLPVAGTRSSRAKPTTPCRIGFWLLIHRCHQRQAFRGSRVIGVAFSRCALSRATSVGVASTRPIRWIDKLAFLTARAGELKVAGALTRVLHLAYEHVPGRYHGALRGDDLHPVGWTQMYRVRCACYKPLSEKHQVDRFVFLSGAVRCFFFAY